MIHPVKVGHLVIDKAKVVHTQNARASQILTMTDKASQQVHLVQKDQIRLDHIQIVRINLVHTLIVQIRLVHTLVVVHIVVQHRLDKIIHLKQLDKIITVLTKVDRAPCIKKLCRMPIRVKVSQDLFIIRVVHHKPHHTSNSHLQITVETLNLDHSQLVFRSQTTVISVMEAHL